jgi:hypothetical protein
VLNTYLPEACGGITLFGKLQDYEHSPDENNKRKGEIIDERGCANNSKPNTAPPIQRSVQAEGVSD